MDRLTETVALSDGRQVVMQELSAMEMMGASKISSAKSPGDMMALTATATCFSIVSVNGQPFQRPNNIVGVQSFMAGIKAKDYNRLMGAYGRLNGDGDEGEAQAADQQ